MPIRSRANGEMAETRIVQVPCRPDPNGGLPNAMHKSATERNVVLALADINADEHIDGLRMSWILHTGLPAIAREHIPTDQRQPASASTLQAVSVLDRSPISDNWLPIRSGDNTPRIMLDWGRESCRTRLAESPIIGAERR